MFRNALMIVAIALFIPISTMAIEITDYRKPDSFYDEAYIAGQFRLNSGNQEQTSFDGTALGYYDLTSSTSPFTWNLRLDGQTNFSRGENKGASTERGYKLLASTNGNKYFNNTGQLFGYGSLDLGHRRLFGADEDDDPYIKLGAGIGYGRVFNATPLAYVLRFVEELKEYNVITGTLDDRTYLELAKIIARESEFKSRYGVMDYEQHWVAEIEKILQSAGVLKGNALGAVGVLKIHDVLFNEKIGIRKHGWLIKGGVGYIASNYNGNESDPSLDLTFEYALPMGYALQFIELTEYSTIWEEDITHRVRNRMSLTYELSDRIDWENLWEFNGLFPTEDNALDMITNSLSSTFRYYLSNQIMANFTVTLTHTEDDIDDNGNDDIERGVFMGITYRLK
ncbi:MAG: hypothetical protein ABFS56_24475 [Pseudomonadota bacterium]